MQTPRIRASGKLAGHFKPKQLKLALMGLGTGGSALGTMEEQITNAEVPVFTGFCLLATAYSLLCLAELL